eukprot:Nk52_evm4s269 gene=Nk52_evmTU4s269
MQDEESLVVGIVGGGIAGLALARTLEEEWTRKEGCRVRDPELARRCTRVRYVVLEKDASFEARSQGYGLTLQQGHKAIKKMGLEEEVKGACCHSKSHFIFGEDGQVVLFWGPSYSRPKKGKSWIKKTNSDQEPQTRRNRKGKLIVISSPSDSAAEEASLPVEYGSANSHIPRQKLRAALLDSLPVQRRREEDGEEVMEWSASFISAVYQPRRDGDRRPVVLTYRKRGSGEEEREEGEIMSMRVSVVVGSDGIHSRVRQTVCENTMHRLNFLGVIVILGIVSLPEEPLVQERVFQTSDGSTRLFCMPFSSSTTMWQLSYPCSLEEATALAKSPATLKQDALRRCAHWHRPIETMIAATPDHLVTGYPVYDREPVNPCTGFVWMGQEGVDGAISGGLVTMIGDAAHPMSPFKGQGANQALVDAVGLGQRICEWEWGRTRDRSQDEASLGGLQRVLREFEREMLERSKAKVLSSREGVTQLHSPDYKDSAYQLARRGFEQGNHGAEKEEGGKKTLLDRIQHMQREGIGANCGDMTMLDCAAFAD